jgi:hypothetical protein
MLYLYISLLQDSFGIDPFYYVNWEDPIYDQNEDFSVEEDAPEAEDSFSEDEKPENKDDSKTAASGNNLKAARQPAPLLLESSSADAASATTTARTSSFKSGRGGAANPAGGGANTSTGGGGGRGHAKSEPALKCDVKRCELPACRCGGTGLPGGGAQRNSTPQLVILTFDDAVNDLSKRLVHQTSECCDILSIPTFSGNNSYLRHCT